MIEPVLVRRLSAIAVFLGAAGSGLALASGAPRVAGGLSAGLILGLLPILFWSMLGSMFIPVPHRAEARQELIDRNNAKASPLVFGLVSLLKLFLYAGALVFLIGRNLVDPLALAGALLAPSLLLAAMTSARRAGAAR